MASQRRNTSCILYFLPVVLLFSKEIEVILIEFGMLEVRNYLNTRMGRHLGSRAVQRDGPWRGTQTMFYTLREGRVTN